ncbi:Sugar kinase of the NBD/HSP70 family, may contain an N-terminal HTH domain [Actinacidiphila rubida]|uniref:Sugar kinase of the NBD/HSP70 family, may contain an N-terminal HTH domain n=4 Tax=Actinacidiphila rubida TaxID=310780 RepID=A0A1H8KMK6_9ACTN|nr:Sugar kinase of the NBD/HSP70 family, may contain an N-terminal HTH domain [Actinacidiphila rubida]
MQTGANLPRVGGYNRAVVLDAVRRRSPVSRVELAQATGLTNQTVSNVVRRLLEAELIRETGQAPSRGGKPRTLLSLCPDGAYAVGAHLDPDSTVAVLLDLSGRVLRRQRMDTATGSDPEQLVRLLGRTVNGIITRAGVPREKVLGLGVAVPGPIDSGRGVVLDPPNLPAWHQVPLVDILGGATQLPVVMDNDATAAAIGERWAGGADRAGSFLFVYMGTGIGGGVMLADAVLRGDSGNAGEFGHVLVDPGGRLCHCGARGCLEAHAAPYAVLAAFAERHGRAAAESLGLSLDPGRTRTDWNRLCTAAARGDDRAVEALETAAGHIGRAALTAVNLLDVPRIVLGGEGLRGSEGYFRRAIDTAVNSWSMARRVRTVSVLPSLIGDAVGAVGAASLVLHGAYAPGWHMLLGAEPA